MIGIKRATYPGGPKVLFRLDRPVTKLVYVNAALLKRNGLHYDSRCKVKEEDMRMTKVCDCVCVCAFMH